MRVLQYAAYGGPDVLHIAEMEMPKLGVAELLVRVHAASVGWGDCKLRSGSLKNFYHITLPKVPGRYGSGVIAGIGKDVRGWQLGQPVLFAPLHTESGSAAEYVRLSANNIALKPGNLNHAETVSMIQGAVSAYACLVQTGQVSVGQKILVHGAAGSIGSACLELARHLGCTITGTCRESDCEYVRSLGAAYAIAFDRMDFSEVVRDQDIVIDLLGGDVHRRSYRVLKVGGCLVYLNAARIDSEVPRTDVRVMNAVVLNDAATLDAVRRLAEQEVFSAKIGKVLPLEDGALAHKLLETRAIRRGRIIISLW